MLEAVKTETGAHEKQEKTKQKNRDKPEEGQRSARLQPVVQQGHATDWSSCKKCASNASKDQPLLAPRTIEGTEGSNAANQEARCRARPDDH